MDHRYVHQPKQLVWLHQYANAAMRLIWTFAAAGERSGSSPLPDAVTSSAGISFLSTPDYERESINSILHCF
jgi:hypothetical protein